MEGVNIACAGYQGVKRLDLCVVESRVSRDPLLATDCGFLR